MSVANPLGTYRFTPGPPTAQGILTLSSPRLHMAYTEQWNLTFERMLGSNSAISLSYVGNRGIGFLQYNGTKRAQFPAVSTVPANYVGNNFTGVLFDQIDPNLFNANPSPGFISLAQPRTNMRRPRGLYGVILQVINNEWTYTMPAGCLHQKSLARFHSAPAIPGRRISIADQRRPSWAPATPTLPSVTGNPRKATAR